MLDASFMNDGFCVANKDLSVYWQSHMLCFYGDTVMAALLWIFIKVLGKGMTEDALKPASVSVFGIFAHGLGHMAVGLSPKADPMSIVVEQDFAVAIKGYFML